MMRTQTRFFWIFGLLAILPSIGCKEKPNQAIPAQSAAEKKTEVKEHSLEVYGDPDIFNQPRLQFVWHHQNYSEKNKRDCIWSIKTDGTDLRKVLPDKLLYTHGAGISHKPIRSPDNRYLVVSMFSDGPILKELFDLKTMTVKTIATGGFKPNFQWTPDSKKIIFVLNGDLVEYDLETEKLAKRKPIYSFGFYLTNNDNRLYAVTEDGFKIHDFQGNLIKRVSFTKKIVNFGHAVSPDGKLMLYHVGSHAYIINTDDPNNPIFQDKPKWMYKHASFSPDNKTLFFSTGYLEKLDIINKKSKIIFGPKNGLSASYVTLINTQEK